MNKLIRLFGLMHKQQKGMVNGAALFFMIIGAICLTIVTTVIVPLIMDVSSRISLSEALSVLAENGYVAYGAPAGDWTTLGDLYTQDIYPQADSTYDQGTNANRYRAGYFDALYGNLTGNLTTVFASITTANVTTLNAPTGRGVTVFVAASNATAAEKAQADVVCNGLTDGTAVDALFDAAVVTVQLSSGTFNFDVSAILGQDDWLTGVGYSTILKPIGDAFAVVELGNNRAGISNLAINGDKATRTGNIGVYITGKWCEVHDVYIYNTEDDGIYDTGWDAKLSNVYITGTGEDGFDFYGTGGIEASNLQAWHCLLNGFNVINSYWMYFTGCRSISNDEDGLHIDGGGVGDPIWASVNHQYMNWDIDTNIQNGIHITQTGTKDNRLLTFTGIDLGENDASHTTTYSDVLFDGAGAGVADTIKFIGCTFNTLSSYVQHHISAPNSPAKLSNLTVTDCTFYSDNKLKSNAFNFDVSPYTYGLIVENNTGMKTNAEVRAYINQLLTIFGADATFICPMAEITGTTVSDWGINNLDLTAGEELGDWTSLQEYLGDMTLYRYTPADSNRLTRADNTLLTFSTGGADDAFSFVVVLNVTNTANVRTIVSKYNVTTDEREYYLHVAADDKIKFTLVDDSAGKLPFRLSDAAVTMGQPIVLIVTYDGTGGALATTGITMYVDGAVFASSPNDDGAYVSMDNTAAEFYLGTETGPAGLRNFYEGDMGLFSIVHRELTADEVWRITQIILEYMGQ